MVAVLVEPFRRAAPALVGRAVAGFQGLKL